MNKKPARMKLDTLRIFLFALSRFIPSNVSHKPRQIKISGKKSFGSYLLTIIFRENKGNSVPKIKLTI
ncbi:hypothetical protein [Clostridium chromiireducens]|uniref:hypothetical protein n=1 Tax=Clostridium chromiireducens TaxID=225345 RepID=UPI001475614E|nr:hypothetical protein [Clostridium chromiireducens]